MTRDYIIRKLNVWTVDSSVNPPQYLIELPFLNGGPHGLPAYIYLGIAVNLDGLSFPLQ